MDLEYFLTKKGHYITITHKYKNLELLQLNIQEQCEDGFEFIGGYYDNFNILLVFYETGIRSEKIISVRKEINFNLNQFKNIFIEEKNKMLIGSIEYEGECIFFFQELITQSTFLYAIAKYPASAIETPDFTENLALKIHQCTSRKDIRFRVCVSYKSEAYLIFIN